MPKKYYAVRSGRETGIFDTWDECKRLVTGFKGAEYKSFTALADAQEYLARTVSTPVSDDYSTLPDNEAVAYVDGSYNVKTKIFGYGAVVFNRGKAHTAYKGIDDKELAEMRNVAGEILGSMYAMEYCVRHEITTLYLYYDYAGIEKWCTGEWKCSKKGTTAYRDFYLKKKDVLTVNFIKVKGHSGNKYNDLADELAKKGAGVD